MKDLASSLLQSPHQKDSQPCPRKQYAQLKIPTPSNFLSARGGYETEQEVYGVEAWGRVLLPY